MKKRMLVIYIVVMIGIMTSLGVSIFFKGDIHANESKAEIPRLIQLGSLNENFLNESETYISQNYGLRDILMEQYTKGLENIFQTSAVNNVIVGKNEFLYFKDTLEDYMGTRSLKKRELFQIVRTLELMNEYVSSQNGKFLFVVAPNKNSLYDEMPYYYQKTSNKKISYEIYDQLDNVPYIDLFKMFQAKEDVLYYRTDSHWNNEGAYYAFKEVMKTFNKKVKNYSNYSLKETKIKGDLYHMLYPNRDANEVAYEISSKKKYKFITKTRSTEQNYIESINEQGQGNLLMFRDSFANNLVDYFSNEYKYAIYDKRTPYNFQNMSKYSSDTVIFEIAERNVKNIQNSYPQFIAPSRNLNLDNVVDKNFVKNLEIKKDKQWVVKGNVQKDMLEDESLVYIESDGVFYELTPQMINNQYGFYGILDKQIKNLTLYLINGKNVYRQTKSL